ncbi:MAG: hypothetical protein HQL70_03320 [Magnetococcales bacterium]|nr:hypothetical protein [Magnetococcales bacterium]
MTWIWILPVLLLLSLTVVFYPLFNKRGGRPLPVGLEGDPLSSLLFERDVVLRHLKELELEGSLDGDEVEQKARLQSDLAAILVRLDNMQQSVAGKKTKKQKTPKSFANSGWGVAVVLLVGVSSAVLYLFLGTPKEIAPTQAPVSAAGVDVNKMVERLAERLKSEPDDRQGWARLARSYAVLGEFEKGVAAYTHLLTLEPDNLDYSVALAEVQIRSGDEGMLKDGLARYKKILTQDPNRPEALWFLGAMALQVGEKNVAISMWQKLLGQLQPGSSNYISVEKALGQAKGK